MLYRSIKRGTVDSSSIEPSRILSIRFISLGFVYTMKEAPPLQCSASAPTSQPSASQLGSYWLLLPCHRLFRSRSLSLYLVSLIFDSSCLSSDSTSYTHFSSSYADTFLIHCFMMNCIGATGTYLALRSL